MWIEDRADLSVAGRSPVTQIAAEVQEFSRRIESLALGTPGEKKTVQASRSNRGRAPRGRPFAVRRAFERGYEVCQTEVLPKRWRGEWVPILGKIAAGAGLDTVAAEQHPAGLADKFVRWHWTCDKPFAVEVCGDSMEPDYLERDIVICDGERRATSGVCCVIFEDRGERLVRLKRLALARGKVHLESLNRKYPPAILSPEKLVAAHEIIEHLPFLKDLPARRR
jgi:SOS-response transcriptional repressor LexA